MVEPCDSGNPTTMKTKVRQPNRLKKSAKVRRSGSARKTLIAPLPLLLLESPHKGPYFKAQWKLSDLLALLTLGLDADHVAPKVNRRKRKQGLTEPEALPVADSVGGEHPVTVLRLLSDLTQCVDDLAVLIDGYGGLLSRLNAANAELEARVAVAEARLDSLLHDKAQVPDLYEGSISAGGCTSVFNIVTSDLPADLSGCGYTKPPKEGAEGVPSVPGPVEGEGAGGVPLGKEAGDPLAEHFIRCEMAETRRLNSLGLLPEPSRFSRLVRKCVAQARTLLDTIARRIAEF